MKIKTVVVTLADGRQFTQSGEGWDTERRHDDGSLIWDDEDDLVRSVGYYYTEGDGGCDCNKRIYLGERHWSEPTDCGDTLATERVVVTLEDGREIVV